MALTLEENPVELWPAPAGTADIFTFFHGQHWIVALTRPRHEKALAEYCTTKNLPYFLPMEERRDTSARKILNVRLPGFLFVGTPILSEPQAYFPILPTNDISQQVDIRRNRLEQIESLVDATKDELVKSRAVSQFLRSRNQLRLRQELCFLASPQGRTATTTQELLPGRPVKVIGGPFRGLEGVVSSQENGPPHMVRFQVALHMLGRVLDVPVDMANLEPLEP